MGKLPCKNESARLVLEGLAIEFERLSRKVKRVDAEWDLEGKCHVTFMDDEGNPWEVVMQKNPAKL